MQLAIWVRRDVYVDATHLSRVHACGRLSSAKRTNSPGSQSRKSYTGARPLLRARPLPLRFGRFRRFHLPSVLRQFAFVPFDDSHALAATKPARAGLDHVEVPFGAGKYIALDGAIAEHLGLARTERRNRDACDEAGFVSRTLSGPSFHAHVLHARS